MSWWADRPQVAGVTPSGWEQYAVEIRIPLSNDARVGSGYLIAPGRILTALHVIVGSLESAHTVVVPSDIKIRAYGDFLEAFGDLIDIDVSRALTAIQERAAGDFLWRPARLAWPRPGQAIPRLDLAILEVGKADRLKRVASAPPVPWLCPQSE